VVELVLELEVDGGLVHGRVCEHGLVNITVSGENVAPTVRDKEYLDGQRLFDTCGFKCDAGTKPETEIELKAPFVEWLKTDIAERGLELGVPYEMTWSCYRDEEPACGTCDACAFRLEAFRNAGSRNPIAYADQPEFS